MTPKDKLEEGFIESKSYTEFRFENSKRQVCSVFKVYPRTKFLAPNNRFKFFWVDSVLSPIDKSLVIIQPEIDCVLFNGYVYVVEWSRFESIFDYEKHLVAAGEKVFEFAEKSFNFRINGLNDMKAKCLAKQRYRRKLAYIAKMLPLKDVKYEALQEFCIRMKLDDPVFNLDDRSLRFNDVRSFLQLMADDILSSSLTSADYIASSRRRFISASSGS